jgi:hypothetical protein
MATATEYPSETEPEPIVGSLTDLASGIMSDVQLLIKQQMSLFRAEFSQDLQRTRQVAQCFGIGIFLLVFSAVMLIVAGVHLLESLTGWPVWACWATIGGFSLVCGIIAIIVGSRILSSYNPLPDKSFHALQENVSCLTNRPK